MFTHSELEIKTTSELKEMCRKYEVRPLGNPGYRQSWINALLSFAGIAVLQIQEGKGLKSPGFTHLQALEAIYEAMSSPTEEQASLLRATLEGRKLNYPARAEQEKLFNFYRAKFYLEQVLELLSL